MITEKIQKCKNILQRYYGSQFNGLILFGSVARGQEDLYSDIDLLVLLKKPFNYFHELRRIVDLLYPLQLNSEQLISAKPASVDEFEQGKFQLYRKAKKEGISL